MKICVIGAGVIGLSVANKLLKQSHEVTIIADRYPLETASAVAGALWYPYWPEQTSASKAHTWGKETYKLYESLVQVPEAGICKRTCIDLKPHPTPDPPWADIVENFRHAVEWELLDTPGYEDAFIFDSLVVDPTRLLPLLSKRFNGLGGKLIHRHLTYILEVNTCKQFDLIINCSGAGAGKLGDAETIPIRGNVVILRPGVINFPLVLIDEEGENGLRYVIPRKNGTVVVGGTRDFFATDTTVSRKVSLDILKRVSELVPQLANVRESDILDEKVGLRPGRSTPLVALRSSGDPILDCIGFSGSG